MIEVQDLHKAFGAVKAVDGVSFTARDGEITGLLGPNGAGKTTTLRMLYTLMQPDRGRVLVDGIDAAADPLSVRQRLGVLPDARGLYKRLSARENIDYFGRLQGLDEATIATRCEALCKALDMGEIMERTQRRILARPAREDRDRACPGPRPEKIAFSTSRPMAST
jgi:sodium transport system ATP-binding protein